jgi:predicted RNase H-like HicB family nuclease
MSKIVNTYTLVYWDDADWVVGMLKEVPGVVSQGKSLDDLMENIIDAYNELIHSSTTVFPAKSTQERKMEISFC